MQNGRCSGSYADYCAVEFVPSCEGTDHSVSMLYTKSDNLSSGNPFVKSGLEKGIAIFLMIHNIGDTLSNR
jgi:hypothetical protein